VKPRLLFLAKAIGLSLVLFALWHPIQPLYIASLQRLVGSLNAFDFRLVEGFEYLTRKMMAVLVPFIGLTLATPEITMRRKCVMIAAGALAYLLMDLLFIQAEISFGIGLYNPQSLTRDSLIIMKWLLPFMLWIIGSRRQLAGLFTPREERS
jgi:hypothetical protein